MPHSTPVINNRRAYHNYIIDEKIEAGIVLLGTEIKAVRMGKVSLRDAHVEFLDNEAILIGINISKYENSGYADHMPFRPRKLLLHKREIKRLARKVLEKGVTVVPLKMYFNDRGFAKVEIGVGRGKRQYDKRQAIAERDAKRDLARAAKNARGYS